MKITNETEYERALDRAEELFSAIPNTPECDELNDLVMAIEEYEEVVYPI